jgi:hypothetical protein
MLMKQSNQLVYGQAYGALINIRLVDNVKDTFRPTSVRHAPRSSTPVRRPSPPSPILQHPVRGHLQFRLWAPEHGVPSWTTSFHSPPSRIPRRQRPRRRLACWPLINVRSVDRVRPRIYPLVAGTSMAPSSISALWAGRGLTYILPPVPIRHLSPPPTPPVNGIPHGFAKFPCLAKTPSPRHIFTRLWPPTAQRTSWRGV